MPGQTAGNGHAVVHAPFKQISLFATSHGSPHAPQLSGSVFVFVQAGGIPQAALPGFVAGSRQHSPLRFTSGSLQHSPLWHVWPVPQVSPPAVAHAPQFASLELMSTHTPLQLTSVGRQQMCDVPAVLHDVFGDCVPQLLPHEPHVASALTFVQTPLQLTWPVGQQTPS
jgi:hypothetical protein